MRLGCARPLLSCVLVVLVAGLGFSQDTGIDQLFEAPAADVEVPVGETAPAAFQAQPLAVYGALTAMAGGVAGFVDKAGGSVFDLTPGISVSSSLTFVARPDETLRIQGTVGFASPSFAPAIGEMFFDYTLLKTLYFRIGKHTVSWSATRLFDAGGDLMSASASEFAVKAALPLGPGGITAVALIPQDLSGFSYRELTYGIQGDLSAGRAELVVSGSYLDTDPTPAHASAALKATLFGIDLFAQGVASWDRSSRPAWTGLVSGFYWERARPNLRLYGEHYFNAADQSYRDHRIALVAGMDNAFDSPFSLGLEWVHSFFDSSGIIIPGLSFVPWPHVSVQIGLPCRYGAPGSFYLLQPPPTVATTTSASDVLTWSQRYGILFRISLSAGF